MEIKAAVLSPTADATCLVLSCRASPATKMPSKFVSNGSGYERMHARHEADRDWSR